MKKNSTPTPVSSIVVNKDKYDLRPKYQRNPVWGIERKQLLIDSILRGYDIPKFYVEELPQERGHEFAVVDGQQRMRALFEFVEDKYPIGEESEDLLAGSLVGKTWSEFSLKERTMVDSFVLDFAVIRDASEQEIRDLFRRLQEGMSLTPAEKRNALLGGMADFIRELAEHKVFRKVHINNKRFEHDDLLAHVTLLELREFNTHVAAKDLYKMYESEASFKTDSKIATKVKTTLSLLYKVLSARETPQMDTKWGFVDLYSLLSKVSSTHSLKGRESQINEFFQNFEEDRRQAIQNDPAALMSTGSEADEDLYRYVEAFQREGNKKSKLEVRRDVYERRLHQELPDLQTLDQTRLFSRNERITVWRRAGGLCQDCKSEVSFSDVETDHVLPWSYGGCTDLSNAQCLCKTCNRGKGAKQL